MNKHSSARDLTADIKSGGGGMVMDRLFLCGHKGSTTGAHMRGNLAWRCAACVVAQARIDALNFAAATLDRAAANIDSGRPPLS